MKDVKHQGKMPMASDAGQMPPTESNPVRQRYQMGCHEGGGAGVSRQRTYSRQFNRGSGGGGSSSKRSGGY